MGYRFTAMDVTYPTVIQRRRNMQISATWFNQAVGRAERDYELWAVLTDETGKEASRFKVGKTSCSQWVKGESYEETVKGRVPAKVKKGTYTLHIAMYDPKTKRDIGLAIFEHPEGALYYTLGEVTVV